MKKVLIQRLGRTTPVSQEKTVRNREVKISVVPDRDENEKQNGPAIGPVPQSIPKPTISPSKGIVIKIENNCKAGGANSENNNFRQGLPGIVARPSGRLQTPVTFPPATSSSTVTTPISVRPDVNVKSEPPVPVQGQTPVGIRVVVQCIRPETTDGEPRPPIVENLPTVSAIGAAAGPSGSSSSTKPSKQKHPSKFQCKICLKGFTRNTTLQQHMRTHTGERPYKCDVCSKKFTTANYLKSHKQSHSGDRRFPCPDCPKSFIQSSTLRVHMKVHTGEKPHVCEYCKRSFATSGDLTKHVRTHTQERPYKCPVCNHGFNQNGNLRRHQQKLGHYDHKALHNAIRIKITPKEESPPGGTTT